MDSCAYNPYDPGQRGRVSKCQLIKRSLEKQKQQKKTAPKKDCEDDECCCCRH